MALHPEMAAILMAQAGAPPVDLLALPLAEGRAAFQRTNLMWNTPLPAMAAHDTVLGGVPCRWLKPANAAPGLIVFVHGGGWTFGSPDSHERFARMLAEQSRTETLLPDYRLAPEHPCPAAIEDVLAVLHSLPAGRVAPCGDSAGANIALAAALARPARPIAALSLLYGCFAPMFDTDSHRRNGDGRFGLSTQRMRQYWRNWLGEAEDPRAAPLHAALDGLPPTHLLAAGLDPVCDDSVLLAGRLAAHGVAVRLDVVPGVTHGFLQMTARLEPARRATTLIAAELRSILDTQTAQP